jgi:glycosyltransferase involved in cell wall biosynthesis
MINNLKNTQKNTLNSKKSSNPDEAQYYDMIVFCHLRWEFVYQRPQHIISRMAKTMKTLFIEEPLYDCKNKNPGNLIVIDSMHHVLQPNVKDIKSIGEIISAYVKNRKIPVGWFYSPSFSPLLEQINFETVVYECIDELSLLKGTKGHLINLEKYLIAHADIIFTGGKSLYETKKQLHNNVHYFPSSVDESHFAKALNGIAIPDDIACIQSPIVGYYGIIDECIDLELLHETALKLPNMSFVMIGSFAQIEEADLPKESNIHYLGMKSYEELPNYLKAFDVAMMPYALNDAARYISPAKTLECMAAGKPIISTKIANVISDYSICVSLIETADEFCEAITHLFDKTDRMSLEMEYCKILKKASWNTTTDKMKLIIEAYTE